MTNDNFKSVKLFSLINSSTVFVNKISYDSIKNYHQQYRMLLKFNLSITVSANVIKNLHGVKLVDRM